MMRRVGGIGAALALVLLMAGCGSVADRVHSALDSASSATASVSTVLHQLEAGLALPAFADTVMGDAITELDEATTELTESGAIGDPDDASVRDDALEAIDAATDAVVAARDAVASGGDPASDIDAVESATDRLHALAASPVPNGQAP